MREDLMGAEEASLIRRMPLAEPTKPRQGTA
jgi:hypothetical protein